MKLSDESCAPVEKGRLPMGKDEAEGLLRLVPGWALKEGTLEKELSFSGFEAAMAFVNRVARVAAAEDHHPEICVSYKRVVLRLTTHKALGLTRNDFIMAAKISGLEMGQ